MSKVYLAEYIADGEIGNAVIRWWTGRQAPNQRESHCELVVGNFCYSSSIRDKGVRRKPCINPGEPFSLLDLTRVASGHDIIVLDPAKWRLTYLPWADGDQVLTFFGQTKGRPYGWWDLFLSQLFRRPSRDTRGDFCNEWAAKALDIVNPREYNPGTFGDLCREINKRYAAWEASRLEQPVT